LEDKGIERLKNDPFRDKFLAMINRDKAKGLAMERILQWRPVGYEPVIVDEDTIERDFGWVFFWTSREYLETQDYHYALAGNCPIIVNKFDGSTHVTGSAHASEYYIKEYEDSLKSRD
jgi:hypothetical protein